MQLLSDRHANVRVRSVIEQQLRERRDLRPALVVHPEIRLRDDRGKERGVSSEAVAVDATPWSAYRGTPNRAARTFRESRASPTACGCRSRVRCPPARSTFHFHHGLARLT